MTDFSTLLEFGFLTSLMESFWVLSTLVLSRSPCCIPLYSTVTYTQERNKTYKNKVELVHEMPLEAGYAWLTREKAERLDMSGLGVGHVRPKSLESGWGAGYVWPDRSFWRIV
jgi:hypothetical protein